MNMGKTIGELRAGSRMARRAWGDNKQYILYVEGGKNQADQKCLNAIVLRTAENEIVPWTCSQTDLLAEDWIIISEKKGEKFTARCNECAYKWNEEIIDDTFSAVVCPSCRSNRSLSFRL